jgi:molecular chaperone DnaJ
MATTKRDYYDVLGIGRNATEDEIRKAYRKLAFQYHPDRNKDAGASEAFKEATEAYEVLSSQDKRSMYDRYGHAATERGFGNGGFSAGFGFDDIFESFFGAGGGGARRSRVQRGNDLRADITLEFQEAVFGVEREISFQRHDTCGRCTGKGLEPGKDPVPCVRCAGTGEVRRVQQTVFGQMVNVSVCDQCRGEGSVIKDPCTECRGRGTVMISKTLRVNIPPGIDDGAQIRLANEGEPGPRGGPPGHLYVVIAVRQHDVFRRQGDDLIMELPINIAQAVLGDQIEIETLDGPATVTVPGGAQTGRTVRLRNLGVPHLRVPGRGDLHVKLKIATPTKLTPEQRDLFHDLAESFGTPIERQPEKGFLGKVKDALIG